MLRLMLFATLCVASVSAHAEELSLQDFVAKVTGPGSGVQVTEEGTIALLYRAHLLSEKRWVEGSKLTFEWQPPETAKGDDGRTYGDHLCVRIRSTGAIRSKRSYEAADGIVIRIDSTNGDVYVQTTPDGGENFENLKNGFKKGSGPISAEWHSVSVLDTDGGITVSLDGKVILTADLPEKHPITDVWGFYNREPVGPGKKVSLLRKMTIVSPPQ